MRKWLTPDAMFRTYREVTPEYLQSLGVRAVLADIDNTLAPYEQSVPDADIRAWVEDLHAAGIRLALVSNNDRERVETFNRSLGVLAFWKSGKPGVKNLRRAMAEFGTDCTSTVVLGDQLLTDALAGKRLGLRVLIVPPIKDKTSLFFRFKRLCERPIIRRFKRQHGIAW